MKSVFKIIMAVTLAVLCQNGYAADDKTEESPAVRVLETGRKAKRLEGPTLKIAKPILKKTPISAIIYNLQ